MLVTPPGIVTLDNVVLFWNALIPMLTTGRPLVVAGIATTPPGPV